MLSNVISEQLPLREQASLILSQVIEDALTEEEYHLLSYELKQYIACHYAYVPIMDTYILAFEQREKLNPNRMQILSENPHVQQIINHVGISLADIATLDARYIAFISDEKILALTLKYAQEIKELVDEGSDFKQILALLHRGQPIPIIDFGGIERLISAGISLKEVLAMDSDTQMLLLKKSELLEKLILDSKIPLNAILSVDKNKLASVLNNSYASIKGILHTEMVLDKNEPEKKIRISFVELLALDKDALKFLFKNNCKILPLIEDCNISFEDILSLDKNIRALIVEKNYAIRSLVNDVGIPFKDIITLDKDICALILTRPGSIYKLVKASVSYKDILELDKNMLQFVFNHMGNMDTIRFQYREVYGKHSSGTIEMLLKHAHFPFKEFLALNENVRKLMIEYSYEIVKLIKNYESVNFNILSRLPLKKLETVLKNPTPQNVQDIIPTGPVAAPAA